jgi:leucyl-tRNA synthetase
VEMGNTVKMSKSKKNVVDPQQLIDLYGADTVRMFCLFASPPERSLEWSAQGVEGSHRFLSRVWRLVTDQLGDILPVPLYDGGAPLEGDRKALHRKTHETIKKVTADIEDRFHFNTAVSAVMELVNETNRVLASEGKRDRLFWSVVREAVEMIVVLLSPVVPHICEELWETLGHSGSLLRVAWPVHREEALAKDTRLVVLQVNGKVRSRIVVPADYGDERIEVEALADDRVRQFLAGKPVKRVVVVQKKLVNIVV